MGLRRYSRVVHNPGEREWYLVSRHGAILSYIAAYPDCTIKHLADAFSLAQRTVWGTISDLRREGMLCVRKDGRSHYYSVNLDARLRLPDGLKGRTLRTILGGIVEQASALSGQSSAARR